MFLARDVLATSVAAAAGTRRDGGHVCCPCQAQAERRGGGRGGINTSPFRHRSCVCGGVREKVHLSSGRFQTSVRLPSATTRVASVAHFGWQHVLLERDAVVIATPTGWPRQGSHRQLGQIHCGNRGNRIDWVTSCYAKETTALHTQAVHRYAAAGFYVLVLFNS